MSNIESPEIIAMKTQEELTLLAQEMHARLESGLSKKWEALERHAALGLLFQQRDFDEKGLLTYDFKSMCNAFAGQRAAKWIQPYLSLHATLSAAGHSTKASPYEFGCDAGVWVAADRTTPDKPLLKILEAQGNPPVERLRQAKVIVLETQSRNFLIVINKRFGQHSLHIREFWPDIREALEGAAYLGGLSEAQNRKDLTLIDVVRLSTAASDYGDDLPGVSYPRRPHLSTFLAGNLIGGDEQAGIGLRYGDSRDKGYLLSVKEDSSRFSEVPHSLHGNLGDVDYVANNLATVMQYLKCDLVDHPEAAPAAPNAV